MAIYSMYGLPIHIHITDENAAAYNRFADAFSVAAKDMTAEDFQQPFLIQATEGDELIYNKVAALMNMMVELNGGSLPYKEEDLTSNHLIKI